ncbi:conserved hypothetical protein [Altererythrobacter sp. B11]|uniref:GTA baseplate fiber-binding domain-containing protein n=1 Tax=Altererythrobacter sp. B11 TaxID=2060312 RepID=UPI000DC72B48|nr:phage tail protein [Altererythrobacter sp. B11]BBC71590.1 conserved hypothetical protein [Altererythrobacter sp. B11]
MATLALTALGTVLGGPLGGAIGSLIGNQIDHAVIGSGQREGPRLKELAVTTSSYGSPIPRIFGTMRTPGTIIWATDLVESREKSGGGKGQPTVTTYSYSVSFAVALAARPILRLGRIWADGNLLRGAAGDLKVGGGLRVHAGHGDQAPDPLIASAIGSGCPAFRGTAYCVFESLQLAGFGNRIPALTFEVVADEGETTLVDMLAALPQPPKADRPLSGLAGFCDEGGPLSGMLATLDQLYPLTCGISGGSLAIGAGDTVPAAPPPLLPAAVTDPGGESFGAASGQLLRRAGERTAPAALRYYDIARDYQAGLQRAEGRTLPGRSGLIEFPGALAAADARRLANAAAERARRSVETLSWRMAEIDPALRPGAVVRVPGRAGHWRIESWEWRSGFIELALLRLPRGPARASPADPGQNLSPPDLLATPTALQAFELPWDGQGNGQARPIHAALSSSSVGWAGAALYERSGADLVPVGVSGPARSLVGTLVTPLAGSAAMMLDRAARCEVQLLSGDFVLASASPEMLANGANRALIGGEVLQFASALPLGGGRWELRGLLRGRGGTEAQAAAGHAPGAAFILLDGAPVVIDPAMLSTSSQPVLAAIGLADAEPVLSETVNAGLFLRPLTPVHPSLRRTENGHVTLRWTRRARGAWGWNDGVDVPLGEEAERYLVGLGDTGAPVLRWEIGEPVLEFTPEAWAELAASHAGHSLWVRQIGSFAVSDPLQLTVVT